MTAERVREALAELNPDALFMNGLDAALVGWASQYPGPVLAVYDEELIIEALVASGLSEEDAWDHYGFNIADAYVGPHTPLIARLVREA